MDNICSFWVYCFAMESAATERIILYPTWMKTLLLYFDLWGFCTQFKISKRQCVFNRVFLTIHLILVSMATATMVIFLTRPIDDSLGSLNDVLKVNSKIVIYWLSLLELNFKHRMQKEFWSILGEFNTHLRHKTQFNFRAFIFKMIVYFILLMLFYLNYIFGIITSKINEMILYFMWISYFVIATYHKNHLFYYLLHLEFVIFELKVVCNELDEMVNCTYNAKNSRNAQLNQLPGNQLKWTRKCYESTYVLCNAINAVFGWSNATVIPLSFLLLLTDINWIYWKIFNRYRIDLIGKQ